MTSRFILSMIALTLLAGCALSEDKVALRYVPTTSSASVEAAKGLQINLDVVDARTTNRTVISRKINGYGMEMAAIRATQNPTELVERALKQELRSRGFDVGNSGLSVTAKLNEFYNQYEVGFFTGSAVSNVVVHILVGDTVAPSFDKTFSANQTDEVVLADGANAKAALEAALGKVVSEVMANPDFMNALVNKADSQTPEVTPSSEDVTS
ncbi:MAG: YajG family lipoprotein [Rhodobiaceae bacterium]|nr:YajG family lipoprotein [Rhodobiaceae bacterium]